MADMIRFIKNKNGNYSMMSNFHLRDKNLSWTAKGILTVLLSFSGEYTIDEIAALAADGSLNTGAGLAELEMLGYLVLKRDEADTDSSGIAYTVYEQPLAGKASVDPVAELPYAEDMPGKPEPLQCNEEEEQEILKDRLRVKKVAEKFSAAYVEAVFIELCRRDAEFRQMMTAEAFEYVCLAVWERQREKPILQLSVLINMYFDHIVLGIRTAGGGSEQTDKYATSHKETEYPERWRK